MDTKALHVFEDLLTQMRAASASGDAASNANISEIAKAALHNLRGESKASLLGDGVTGARSSDDGVGVHRALKAVYEASDNYQPGTFLQSICDAHSNDYAEQKRAKKALEGFGITWSDIPDGSINKATLGLTGATGGYVLPNNLVDSVVKPKTMVAQLTQGPDALLTIRSGVAVRGVDMPFRTGAPTRMQFANWGATKENVNEDYGSYTAALATMARIYDVSKQYVRISGGAAEQDVMDELTRARDLGETYYTLAGAGTGTYGSGDPTTGFYTALAAGPATYRTAFAGANAGTIAGNAAAAIAQGIKAMNLRSRTPTAVVTDPATFWAIAVEGSDTGGFFAGGSALAGAIGPAGVRWIDGTLTFWGVPLLFDANFDSYTGTTKAALMADFKAFKFYRGSEFRIDTSDVAGTRWDMNLLGVRGEQEIGFNASAGVAVGAAQWISAIVP